jgi:hypothetical protein
MKKGTMWRVAGVVLLTAAVVMYVWPRGGGEGVAIVDAVRRFEGAAGDPKARARECGPRTREWMKGMIEAAKTEHRSALVQRDMLEMSTILDLRQGRTLASSRR